MDERVVPPAERAQVLERRRSAPGPRHDVMPVHVPVRAARKTTAPVPEAERSTQQRWDRSPATADVEDVSAGIVDDLDDRRVA